MLESATVSPANSIIPANVPGATNSGAGLGSILSTNNANMPPFPRLSQEKAYKLCLSHKFQFRGRDYYNRLLRRKENVVAQSLPSSKLVPTSTSVGMTDDTITKGCFTNPNKADRIRLDTFPVLNLNNGDEKYPFINIYGSTRLVLFSSGSTSTSNCVSRFGLQDFVGNLAEWTSDVLWCHRSSDSKTNGMCSPRYKNLDPNSTPTDLFTPPWDSNENGNILNYQSANGTWYEQGEQEIMGMNPKSASQNTILMTMAPYFMGGTPPTWSHDSNYFNVAMGLPLRCAGDSCGDSSGNNPEDDNLLVTTRTKTQTTATRTNIFQFDFNGDVFLHRLNIQDGIYNTPTWGLLGSSSYRTYYSNYTATSTGRWSHIWVGYVNGYSEPYNGARCGIMIEEDEEGVIINGTGNLNPISSGTNNMSDLL
jgi:hypothetical protein